MVTTTVQNNAELSDALAGASGGDIILCAPGDYGEVTINNSFLSTVFVKAADPGSQPVFSRLFMNGAAFIELDRITFDYVHDPADSLGITPFDLANCDNITIRNCVFDGELVFDPAEGESFGWGFGLDLIDDTNCRVTHCEFFHFAKSIRVIRENDLTIDHNNIHNTAEDGIIISQSHNVTVEFNLLRSFKARPGDHGDMIQVFTHTTVPRSTNVTIRKNFATSDSANILQGLFMRNGRAETSGDPADYYTGFLIEDNIIYSTHGHGISIGACDGAIIRRNTLLHDVDAEDFGNAGSGPPKITLLDADDTVSILVDNNVAHNQTFQTPASGTMNDHFLVQRDNPAGAGYYGDEFVNALIPSPTLADLQPKPGGTIATQDHGANLTAAELEDVGPESASGTPPQEIIAAMETSGAVPARGKGKGRGRGHGRGGWRR